MIDDIQNEYSISKAKAIDNKIFNILNLSDNEKETIGFVEIV